MSISNGVGVGNLFLDLKINSSSISQQLNAAAKNAQKSANSAFGGVGKGIAKTLSTVAIGSFIKSSLDLGSNLSEVQNVVDVTFPSMSKQIDTFAQNAISQFGLSETVAKRMTGTFGSMAKAFGFSENAAYDMATSLTGLAGDVASFYNLDPTEAYTKLKSVFTGETESLKDLGVVMTQNALDQFALANGYGKTTSAMTEQEKVALRLAFVTDKLSAASGDFSRTSDSWANKVRVLGLNFESLQATLGQGFINILSPLVSLLNNVIVKLQTAAQYFTAFTSLLSGNKKTSTTLGSVSSNLDLSASNASTLANNMDSVGNAAKKASKQMGTLASFDEIKNISASNNTSGSGTSSGVSLSNMSFADGINKASNVDTSNIEATMDKIQAKWDSFTAFFKKNGATIVSVLAGITAGFIAFETIKAWGHLSKGISTISIFFKVLKAGIPGMQALAIEFTGLNPMTLGIVAGIAAVTGGLVYLYKTSSNFRNLVNKVAKTFSTLLSKLWKTVLVPLFNLLKSAFKDILVPLAEFIASGFVNAIEVLASVTLTWWNDVLAPVADFLIKGLAKAIQSVSGNFISFGYVIQDLVPSAIQIFEGMSEFFIGVFTFDMEKAWSGIKLIFEGFDNFLQTIFVTDWRNVFGNDLGEALNTFLSVVKSIWDAIKGVFSGMTTFVSGVFSGDWKKAWQGITSILETFDNFLSNIFAVDWKKIFGNTLGGALNTFSSTVKSIWDTIKGVFNGIITFINGTFSGNWSKAWQGVKSVFSSIVSGLANIFKSPINLIIDGINTFIGGLNKIKIPSWVPGVGGKGFNISKIPRLAEGGYVKANTPQLAMIGDNRTQGEIVSPEDKMYEVMMSALKAFGSQNANREDVQVLVAILYEILDAINNLHLVVDGDSLNDDKNKRDRERALRTGKLILG